MGGSSKTCAIIDDVDQFEIHRDYTLQYKRKIDVKGGGNINEMRGVLSSNDKIQRTSPCILLLHA
jgi:hypothetical protein